MAISIQTASKISTLCSELKPKRILDMGSGFSSYITRSYSSMQKNTTVFTIDDNIEWLELTEQFLLKHGLQNDNLYFWDEFISPSVSKFDLVIHDLGNMKTRITTLPFAFNSVQKEIGVLLLDDMHKKDYRTQVYKLINKKSCNYFNLIYPARDGFGRFCGLVYEIDSQNQGNPGER
jgi:hypothetical protein